MKRILFTVISFLTVTGMTAQTVDANAVMEKTSNIYKTWEGMRVQFSADIRMNNASESFDGILLMKNNKFLLTTPGMMIWFDGTTQWTYMIHLDEVNINTPSDDELRFLNPMILLNDYKKDFTISLSGESTSVNAKMAYDITLIPNKKNDIEKIEIQIEKNTSLPAKMVVFMRNQILNTVIDEMKSEMFSDEIFSFQKASYPNVEIIDLR